MIHVAMFVKYWQAGTVKTRLAGKIGDVPASQVYLAFVRHLLDRLCNAGDRRSVVYSPHDSADHFLPLASDKWELQAQIDGDLGRRLSHFFDTSFTGPQDRVIVIGSDTPDISTAQIDQTARLLEVHPVVIGPSVDGGYYLIAMSGQRADIFENIPWSTDGVLPATLRRLKDLGIDYAMLPEMRDVDDLSDLVHLQHALLGNAKRDALDQRLLQAIQSFTNGKA